MVYSVYVIQILVDFLILSFAYSPLIFCFLDYNYICGLQIRDFAPLVNIAIIYTGCYGLIPLFYPSSKNYLDLLSLV